MATLSLKLPDDLVRQIDLLVRRKRFRSRNEVLRKLIASGVQQELSKSHALDFDEKKIHELLVLLKKTNISLAIDDKRTAADIVAEGRER
ncbi:MAG TPA: ribbon-helix-helix domain-containing protein [Candidatus Hodarchaeales archaeon]|nr:ribbon-helix-helix domain-containing protein [Candidatus Hodarchaeales archaeon]